MSKLDSAFIITVLITAVVVGFVVVREVKNPDYKYLITGPGGAIFTADEVVYAGPWVEFTDKRWGYLKVRISGAAVRQVKE